MLDTKVVLIAFWLTPSVVVVIMVAIRSVKEAKLRHRRKREYVFGRLRMAGYNITDVNSNATRAKLSYMDPFEEKWVWRWVDIVQIGKGYGLADPINSERN